MPANLPPQYFEAEKRYTRARTPQEKVEALEDMLSIMPHHKGTDKLRAELRTKVAKFYEEVCLLEQPFIKDPTLKVKDILTSMIAKIGENIIIRRFVRYQVGEEL